MKTTIRVFIVTLIAIISFWVIHSIIDASIFHSDNILMELFNIEPDEVFILLSFAFVFFIYACYISYILRRYDKLNSELKSSEDFLNLTLHSIGDAVIVADDKGRILKLNNTAEILTGWQLKDAYYKHIEEVFVIINEITRQKAEDPFNKVVKEGVIVGLANHTALISKDGKEYSIADSAAPIFRENGSVAGVVIVFRDVSQERAAQKELQYTLQRHDSIISHTADAILLVNEEGRIIEWNNSMEKISLLKKEDAIGQFHWDIRSKYLLNKPDSSEQVEEFKHKVLNTLATGGGNWLKEKNEFYVKRPDGSIRYFEQEGFLIPHNKKYWLASVIHDVTERKEFIESLKSSEEKFSNAFQVCQDSIIVTRKSDSVIIDVNPKFELEFGYKKDEIIGKRVQDIRFWINKEQREAWNNEMSSKNQTLDFEAQISTKKGIIKDILVSSAIIYVAGDECVISYNKDITEKKLHDKELQEAYNSLEYLVKERTVELETANEELNQINTELTLEILEREKAEFALKESENKYRTLISQLPLGVYRTTIDGRFLQTNPALAHILGFNDEEELKKQKVHNFYLNENVRDNFINKQRITGEIVREEIELKRNDGKLIWVRDTGRTILDENKNPIFTDGIIEDITDRKIARRELEFQYNFLQILIDTIPNPIYYKDAVEKRYIGCNLAFTNFFDKTKEEIIGKSVFDLYPLDAAIIYDEKDCELIKKGGIQRYDDSMKDAKGKLHYNIIYRSRYNDSNGNTAGIVGIVLDITEMTIAQEQLFWESSMNSAMAALSQAILSEMSIQKISEMVLSHGKKLTNSAYGFVGTYNEITKIFNLAAYSPEAVQEPLSVSDNIIFEKPKGLYGWVLLNKKSIISNNPDTDSRSAGVPEGHFKLKNFISAPILYREELLGSIAFANSQKDYSEKDLIIIERLATVLSLAIYRIKSEEELLSALIKQQELNDLKSSFISMVSHEYRTPLQAILMSTQLLANYGEKISQENRSKYFNMIEESVKTMDNFLNDIISYNKVEKGKIKIEYDIIDIEQFILSFVREMQFIAGDKCIIDLTLKNGNRLARIDQRIIRQILENLLNNAIKFSPYNSTVKFDVNVYNDSIEFIIADEGVGIKNSDFNKVFDPFFRGKNISNIPGTGLGLPIVKNSLEAINGTIDFTSTINKGTTFVVNIPLNNEENI